MLVSERIGQFFFEDHRIEYTEYGGGDRWVVLIHGQLMPRRMHQPLARALAAAGNHVVTVDLLGHGRSDRPADPMAYSMTGFGEQVLALLDELGAERAVIGGTSLGANVSLEVAVAAPGRVQGMILEMPVLDNGLDAGLAVFAPMMFLGRYLPWTVTGLRLATRAVPRGVVPFWTGVLLDTLGQRPAPLAAAIHGIFFGRIAPPSRLREQIDLPALVVGHAHDPVHRDSDARMVAAEIVESTYVRATSILEWRYHPERLTDLAIGFVESAWGKSATRRRVHAT